MNLSQCPSSAIKVVLATSLVLLLSGCASGPSPTEKAQQRTEIDRILHERAMEREAAREKRLSEQLETLPEWALEPPKADGNGFYGVGIARSESMSAAMDKAGLKADFNLAKQMRQRVSGLSKDFTADDGATGAIDERFEQAVERLVLPVNMVGQQVVEQEVRVVDGEFSVVLLKQMSFDRMEQMLAKHQSSTGVDSMTSAFEELRERIEATQ